MQTLFERAQEQLLTLLNMISPHQKPTLLLGLSGGIDSVFLFHLLVKAQRENKLDFIAAHLNHQWRTDADETVFFCKTLCEQHAVPFVSDILDNYAHQIIETGSLEDKGRQARLLFFEKICTEHSIHWRIMGHHFDDQIESFFIKLLRGTTLEGIGGMQMISPNTLRPLLIFHKKELEEYLRKEGHTWHHDYTNDSDEYLRNQIRAQLIPLLKTIDQRSTFNISRFQAHARLDADFFNKETDLALARISDTKQKLYSKKAFFNEHPAIQKRILAKLLYQYHFQGVISEGIILEIIRYLMHNQGGTHQIKELVIHKKQDFFWFSPH